MEYRLDRKKGVWHFLARRAWMVWMILSRRHVMVLALTDVRGDEPVASMGWSKFCDEGAVDLARHCLNEMDQKVKVIDAIEEITK